MSDHLQDERERGWFHLDNYLIEEYLPRIGVIPFAVFACLARHANRDLVAFPSYSKLQKHTGCGRAQIAAAIKTLADAGLIIVSSGDVRTSNRYRLVTPPSSGAKLVAERNYPNLVPERNQPSSTAEPPLVPERNCNKTKLTRPTEQEGTPPTPSPGVRVVVSYSEEFITFWKAYPRGENKPAAWRAWQKEKPDLEAVLAAIPIWQRSEQWRKGKVPHPATWLNARQWEDTPFHPQATGNQGGTGRLVF